MSEFENLLIEKLEKVIDCYRDTTNTTLKTLDKISDQNTKSKNIQTITYSISIVLIILMLLIYFSQYEYATEVSTTETTVTQNNEDGINTFTHNQGGDK